MEKVLLFLDVEDSGILKYEYLTEDAISVAATLAQKMIARGMEVGLCTNITAEPNPACPSPHQDFTCLHPSGSRKQLTDIERLLAIHRSDAKVLPLPAMLDSFATEYADQTEDAVMIFISKNTGANQTAIEAFTGREQAIWVVPCPRNEACGIHTADNIRLIGREVYDF